MFNSDRAGGAMGDATMLGTKKALIEALKDREAQLEVLQRQLEEYRLEIEEKDKLIKSLRIKIRLTEGRHAVLNRPPLQTGNDPRDENLTSQLKRCKDLWPKLQATACAMRGILTEMSELPPSSCGRFKIRGTDDIVAHGSPDKAPGSSGESEQSNLPLGIPLRRSSKGAVQFTESFDDRKAMSVQSPEANNGRKTWGWLPWNSLPRMTAVEKTVDTVEGMVRAFTSVRNIDLPQQP